MKNIPSLISLPLALLAPAAIISSAYAEDYVSVAQAQKILFPDASIFLESSIQLTDAQIKQIKKKSGVRQRQSIQQAWRAEKNGELLGWFYVDEVIGKHEFITYATAIDLQGTVRGIEILSYRETHGGQVRKPEWRQHFINKTLNDPFKLNKDIPNISGATLSCRNLTDGVKRLLILNSIVHAQPE